MTVAQRLPAQLVHQVDPPLGLAVVLVVAGDVDTGPSGPHGAQGRSLGTAALGRAVGDVAGVADQVGFQCVHGRADAFRPAGAVEGTVVGVCDQDDPRPVQTGPQTGESHIEPAYARHASGLGVPPGEQHGGHTDDGPGDGACPVLPVTDAGHGEGEPEQDAEQDGPGEQDPYAAQQRVADDRRRVLLAPAVAAHHGERHTDQAEGEQRGADQRDGQRPVLAGVQEDPARHGPQQDGGDQRDVAHQALQSAPWCHGHFTGGGSGVVGLGHASPPEVLPTDRAVSGAGHDPPSLPWFCSGLDYRRNLLGGSLSAVAEGAVLRGSVRPFLTRRGISSSTCRWSCSSARSWAPRP